MITGTYSGDSTHSSSTGSFIINVRPSPKGKPVLLTFTAFDADDFNDGIGQLDVIVNGQLVADIPGGLNHLTGTGDYEPYEHAAINFGPFDITSLLVSGQNTILFKDPTSFDHFAIVYNVLIRQDGNSLLSAPRARGVYPAFQFSYTFSLNPLAVTSFTQSISPNTANSSTQVALTATYTGGTGPFTCGFTFGDGHRVTVTGVNGVCTASSIYSTSGTFIASVTIRGASTSDIQQDSFTLTI